MNIPNMLTLFRIALIPVFVIMFYLPFSWSFMASAVVFVLAAVTDWLDGFLARRRQQVTPLGQMMDPLADKLLTSAAFIALVQMVTEQQTAWFTIPALVVVGREILVSALREWMAEIGKRTSVAVSWVGKVKTFVQMLAIITLLAVDPGKGGPWLALGYILFYAAAALTLWSAVLYVRAAWGDLSDAATRPGRAN